MFVEIGFSASKTCLCLSVSQTEWEIDSPSTSECYDASEYYDAHRKDPLSGTSC